MTPSTPASSSRLVAIDALRGLVIVIMTLDHVRDFIHAGAMVFSPEDLARTTPILFFTRWITHLCAPVFAFSAGAGAYLRRQRTGSTAELSRFLLTRGIWLVLVELTVMRLAMNFNVGWQYPVLLLVLWSLGISMIAMAALIHLPIGALAVVSIGTIALHNVLDGVQATQFGALGWIWNIVHQSGVFIVAGVPVVVGYPVVPWVAVMTAGYCFGPVLLMDSPARRRVLLGTGAALVAGFVIFRTANVYGDPSPWASQPSAMMTLLSFLRTTKYPASLLFLMMTLGPALLVLAWFDRRGSSSSHPLVVIGRVPLFYYVIHFWMIHVVASAMAGMRYGEALLAFLFHPLPSMGGPRNLFPADFGYPLWTVYVVWLGIVLLMYPLCRWFSGVKSRRRDWWLGYL